MRDKTGPKRPYQGFSDRKLLKTYLASKEYSLASGTPLTFEGCLQADELEYRRYNVNDIEDIKQRLQK